MVNPLRLFLNRPVHDADRPRLFALAVVVIVAASGLLALVHDASPPTRPVGTVATTPPAPAVAALPPASATASPPPSAASEEGRPPASSAGSRTDVAGAKRAARRFLSDYLPYSYGRGRAQRVAAATAGLRRRLVRQRPRVPARERRLRPRLVLLQSDAVSHRRAQLLALVGDGARRYTLGLERARIRAGWTVTDVGA